MKQMWVQIGLTNLLINSLSLAVLLGVAQPRSLHFLISQTPVVSQAVKQTNRISAAQIRNILDQIMLAARKRDTNTVIKYLAPNVVVNLTVQSPLGTRKLTLNREQYRQYLQQGFDIAQGYNSQLSNLKVQVDSSGKWAIATYTLVETVTIGEPVVNVTSATDASVRFERVGGQILATGIKSASQVDVKSNRD